MPLVELRELPARPGTAGSEHLHPTLPAPPLLPLPLCCSQSFSSLWGGPSCSASLRLTWSLAWEPPEERSLTASPCEAPTGGQVGGDNQLGASSSTAGCRALQPAHLTPSWQKLGRRPLHHLSPRVSLPRTPGKRGREALQVSTWASVSLPGTSSLPDGSFPR